MKYKFKICVKNFFMYLNIWFLCLFSLLGFSSVQADDSSHGKILFILDGSGSMLGQIEGKPKIVIAKKIMTNLIQNLPDDIQVGLQVYGHRAKGDCNDIEILSPISKINKAHLIKQIQSIQPKGKTAITRSLEIASQLLKDSEEETMVVLISDGKETCHGDPCLLVKKLRNQGINLKMHVVGFDVSPQERNQLSCIAEAGGGKYFSVDNTSELKKALTEVKREALETAKIKSKTLPNSNKSITGIKLSTILFEDSKPLNNDLYYSVYKVQQNIDGRHYKKVAYSYKAQPLFKLKAGKYLVKVKYGIYDTNNAVSEIDITVKAGELVEQIVNLDSGYMRLVTVPNEGGKPLNNDLYYSIYKVKQNIDGKHYKKVAYSSKVQPLFKLKAGKYLVKVKHGIYDTNNAISEIEITVKAGELVEQIVNLNSGYLRLATVPMEGNKPLKRHLHYEVYKVLQDIEGKHYKKVAYSYKAKPLFKLKAGKYLLKVRYGETKATADIEITAGVLKEYTISLHLEKYK